MESDPSPNKLIFLGDVCLARSLYGRSADTLVDTSVADALLSKNNCVVGNMESVLRESESGDCDHLDFQGDPSLLRELQFVDIWGLANNHINDFGDDGIRETIEAIERAGFRWSGVNNYMRMLKINGFDVAVIFAADMMNKSFDKDQEFSTLDLYSHELELVIEGAVKKADFAVLYAHTGLLFCPYPSVKIRERLLQLTEKGLSAILTAHSHCTGGIEWTKHGVPIVHSLGDTIMDGASFRRRRSTAAVLQFLDTGVDVAILDFSFKQKVLVLAGWVHHVRAAAERRVFSFIMKMPQWFYVRIFNWLYRLSMLAHIASTLRLLLLSLGVRGTVRRLALRRAEVFRFASWLRRDRKKSSTDYDAILPDRKVIKVKDLQ